LVPLREAVPRRVRALSMQLVITISYAKRTTCSGVMAIADPGDTDLLSVAERHQENSKMLNMT
jgi:hypothetical protein